MIPSRVDVSVMNFRSAMDELKLNMIPVPPGSQRNVGSKSAFIF
jgi:hypothetical protein